MSSGSKYFNFESSISGSSSPNNEDEDCRNLACSSSEAIALGWEPGDMVTLDNVTVVHARCPFEGSLETSQLSIKLFDCSWEQFLVSDDCSSLPVDFGRRNCVCCGDCRSVS